MFRRMLFLLMLAVVLSSLTPGTIQACPMCKVAHEDSTDPAVAARPKAYMYSILFMLAMPATIFSTFGVAFYRLSREQQRINDAVGFMEGLSDPPIE